VRVFTLTLIALLTAVVGVNAAAAWRQRLDEARVQAVPAALRPGHVVLGYRNVDERSFQRARLRVIPRPRVVAFGSSRVMQLTGALVGAEPGAFYNLGMSGATVEDFIGLWETLRRQGKVPERALFSIDPWIFNAEVEPAGWRPLAPELEAFVAGRGVWWPWMEGALTVWTGAKELVSYEILRDSARRLRRAARRRPAEAVAEVIVPEPVVGDRQALRADGSLIYDGMFQRRDARTVREDALRWAATDGAGLARFRWAAERATQIDALWRDLRGRGVELVVYLPPYHPAAWRVIEADARQRESLERVRSAVSAMAEAAGAAFGDFADPASIPCGAEEFFDGQHPRPSCLKKLVTRLEGRTGKATLRSPGR
jgi:hypothetical protein